MKFTAAQEYLETVVTFGSIPMRRIDIYRHCIADGMSKPSADFAAFHGNDPTEDDPWTLEEFHQFLFERHGWKPEVPETKKRKG